MDCLLWCCHTMVTRCPAPLPPTQELEARYGAAEVRSWYFEIWNEPNCGFLNSTMDGYYGLYQHTVSAIKSVDSNLRVGGPATCQTGYIAEFLASEGGAVARAAVRMLLVCTCVLVCAFVCLLFCSCAWLFSMRVVYGRRFVRFAVAAECVVR